MRRKIGILVLTVILTLCGCGAKSEEVSTSLANPWTDADEEGVLAATGFDLVAPEGATDVHYSFMDEDKLAQMTYSMDNISWVYRVKAANELEDISGMNYEWVVTEEGTVSGREAIYMAYSDASEDTEYLDSVQYVQVVNWYDVVPGVTYSLSASGNAVNGMDIQVLAEQIFF